MPKLKVQTVHGHDTPGLLLSWLQSLGERKQDELAALIAGTDRSVLSDCGILGDWIEEHGGRRSYAGWLDFEET